MLPGHTPSPRRDASHSLFLFRSLSAFTTDTHSVAPAFRIAWEPLLRLLAPFDLRLTMFYTVYALYGLLERIRGSIAQLMMATPFIDGACAIPAWPLVPLGRIGRPVFSCQNPLSCDPPVSLTTGIDHYQLSLPKNRLIFVQCQSLILIAW
jgi:hypothetical protein